MCFVLADTSNSLSVVLSNEFKGHTETRRRTFVFAVTVLSAAPRHKRSSLQESGQNVDRPLRSLQLRVYSAEQILKHTQSRDHSSKRLQEKTGSRTRYLRLGLPCLLPPSAAVSPAPSHPASCSGRVGESSPQSPPSSQQQTGAIQRWRLAHKHHYPSKACASAAASESSSRFENKLSIGSREMNHSGDGSVGGGGRGRRATTPAAHMHTPMAADPVRTAPTLFTMPAARSDDAGGASDFSGPGQQHARPSATAAAAASQPITGLSSTRGDSEDAAAAARRVCSHRHTQARLLRSTPKARSPRSGALLRRNE
ncbi:hypothetical protein HPB50_021229 [Hyalomma asiaticum]|uniref:Uncharacterized protein n=1 Tax=Hyalomma asiaticum TaxID=266040 RepID=A0ACB7RW30_HYAAI|nr:hypothetical protein HPB50_021229 [Hyalomma asiaticum]